MFFRPANYEEELRDDDLDHVARIAIGVTPRQAIIAGYVLVAAFCCAWFFGLLL